MVIRKATEKDFPKMMKIYANARDFMKAHGNPTQWGHLRIDTHGDNIVMQNIAKKLNFIHCGTIYVEEDDYPRLAYEKSKETLGLK